MKTITEEQAQELADLSQHIITQDKDKLVEMWDIEEDIVPYDRSWNTSGNSESGYETKWLHGIIISSTRPWTEQIWRPRG